MVAPHGAAAGRDAITPVYAQSGRTFGVWGTHEAQAVVAWGALMVGGLEEGRIGGEEDWRRKTTWSEDLVGHDAAIDAQVCAGDPAGRV